MHFLGMNFLVSANELLNTLPHGTCKLVSVQFPDPWKRQKHLKRQIIQPSLVVTLANHMDRCSSVYLSSDCEDVCLYMRQVFEASSYFEICSEKAVLASIRNETNDLFMLPKGAFFPPAIGCSDDDQDNYWLSFNPLSEPTEREIVCENKWRSVWRCVFVRNHVIVNQEDILESERDNPHLGNDGDGNDGNDDNDDDNDDVIIDDEDEDEDEDEDDDDNDNDDGDDDIDR